MTVSFGSGVDLGNLVTAIVDPITGVIEIFGPDGAPVIVIGDASLTL